MSASFYLGWTDGLALHHHDPAPLERAAAEHLAEVTRNPGRPKTVLSEADLKTWKEKEAMEALELANGQMMTNADGLSVPERMVPGRIKLEDQTVCILIKKALAMQAAMAAFKLSAFSDIYAFLDELSAAYGARRAGSRGGVLLNSYDALSKVEVSVADTMVFGPELASAQTLINECIQSWTQGANDNLRVVVNDAFRAGRGGKIRVDRVIGLRRLEIDDDRWKMAMVAIADAIRTQGSVSYIRFYHRESPDLAWQHISLDMSRVA